ncbi:MAG: hypothetical protein ACJ74Z_17695 [Bryobacteraceae bacterium]
MKSGHFEIKNNVYRNRRVGFTQNQARGSDVLLKRRSGWQVTQSPAAPDHCAACESPNSTTVDRGWEISSKKHVGG